MKPTTVKLSVETRDRIRALGGQTYEDTIVDALDALEADRFWAQADTVYAVDLIRSLAADRLLDRIDRAPVAAMAEVRRALLNIT